MRSIIVIAILVLLFGCKTTNTTAQPTAYNRYLSLSVTPVDAFLKVRYAFAIPSVSDTTLNGGLDSLGSLIQVKSGSKAGMWRRDSNIIGGGHIWVQIADAKNVTNYWQLSGSNLYPTSSTYNVGVGGTPAFKFDVQSGSGRFYFDGTRAQIADGSGNLLIGALTGNTLSGGVNNVAFGDNALRQSPGSFNTAIGIFSLASVNGSRNVAIGGNSLTATDSSDNTTIGFGSGYLNYGKRNTSVGAFAGNFKFVDSGHINNSEIQTPGTVITGSTTATFISAQSLTTGEAYPFNIHFNGGIPDPYGTTTDIFVHGVITNSNTITLRTATFTSTGSGTFTISLYNRQSNSIAIGYNIQSDSANQIRIGNNSNTLVKIGQNLAISANATPVEGWALVWHTDRYVPDSIGGGGGTSVIYNSPLHLSSGHVSVDDAVADGTTKGVATFATNDFNSSGGVISTDYANGQAASGSTKGFLSTTDWTTFNNKQATLTGTASSIATASITANRVMITDGSQKAAASRIDTIHIGFLGNVSSDIQTQLNAKLTTTLSSAQVFVGNASNVATARALTGVVAITNTGVTSLAASGVTAGPYSNANIVVGADGRITSASNGSAASVSSVFGRTGAVVAVSGDYTTSLVTEGSNLYYTTTRFNTALATKTTSDLAEGTNLYYTNVRADARITAQKGVANGIADLDAGGHVPVAELPAGAQTYKGTWNANTNTPTLVDGTGTAGWTYRVVVAGTQDLGSGSIVWAVGDDAIYDGTIWQRNPAGTGAVSSVNGFTGAVVLTTTNISEGTNKYFSGKTTTDLPEGSSLYFTNSRARSALSAGTGISFNSSTGAISLPASGVTAATYTNPTITVNAQGVLTAASNGSSSSVTMVSGTSPIIVANPITTPVISILNAAADGSTKGAAWFNSNDFNDNGSGGISLDYTNGQSAGTSTKGYLTSTDWNTFNNKVPTTRTITAGTGLTGGGDLSANRTITLSTISGFITAGANVTITGSGTIASPFSIASSGTGGGGVSSFAFTNGGGFTGTVTNSTTAPTLSLVLQNAAADGSTKGQSTYNANQFDAATGVISLDTINGPKAAVNHIGFLTSTDWATFNLKQPAATGAVTTVMNANLTALRVAVSNGAGKLIASSIDTTHLGYLAHANADLQDQIDAIVTTTGTVIQNTFINLTDGATINWTYSSSGTKRPHANVVLSGANHRIAISGDAEGESGVLRVVQPSSGSTFYDIKVPVGDLLQDAINLGGSADTIDLPEGNNAVAILNYIKLPAGNRVWFYAYVH